MALVVTLLLLLHPYLYMEYATASRKVSAAVKDGHEAIITCHNAVLKTIFLVYVTSMDQLGQACEDR